MRRVNTLESCLEDFRYGLRQLRRSPGFTAVAVLAVAPASAPPPLSSPWWRRCSCVPSPSAIRNGWWVQTMEEAISQSEAPRRFDTTLIAFFALGGAVLLAALGLYAVIASSVSPAHARNRYSHDAGGGAERCFEASGGTRLQTGARGSEPRDRRGAGSDPLSFEPALRRQAYRPPDAGR